MSQCLRILHQNWLDQANALSISSADASFPFANLQDGLRRTKLWRSAGHWEVISGSNTIVFEETAATPLTATIAAGDYSSSSAFFAAVKAALEAAGGSVYTVAADPTTGKVKITSDGAGGGGILNLLWTDGGSAAMAAMLGFSTAADDTGALTYTADLLRIMTDEWVKFDLGMAGNPKAFALIAERNLPLRIQSTATIEIEGNGTDVWTAPEFQQTVTYDSEILALLNENGFHTDELRYWRMRIRDLDNPLQYIDAGYIYLGDTLVHANGAAQFPLGITQRDANRIQVSETGQIFADQYPDSRSSEFELNWSFLTKDEKEDVEQFFEEVGRHTPWFVSLDSDAAFGTAFQRNMKYVRWTDEPSFSLFRPNKFRMTMRLREVL